MVTFKSANDVKIMAEAGRMLHIVIDEVPSILQVGMTTAELDQLIDTRIHDLGGEPGFKKVHGWKWASCICVNDQVVHTPPSKRVIKDGDVVIVDTGVYFNGFHSDSAITVQAGNQTPEVKKFLETGRTALHNAVKQAIEGKHIGDISLAFEKSIESEGYSIIPELTGHGIGRDLHEDPYVPCFLDEPIERTMKLKKGMTLALEVLYAMGEPDIEYEPDGWSMKTVDGSLTACFEHTVAIVENKPFILT